MSDGRKAGWWSLFPLVLGTFFVACEGTLLTGVLPRLSVDVHAEPGAVGAVLAIYPFVYVFGAPVLAVVAGGRPQRVVCTAGMVLFAVGNLVSASATSLVVLAAGRLVASVGACSYLPNAAARALSLGSERRGRVLSILSSGSTAATLVGAPLGIYAASVLTWRWVLVVIAGGALCVITAQWFSKLEDNPVSALGVRDRLRLLRERSLVAVLVLTVVVVLGEFVVYAYISLLAQHNVDAGPARITTALLVFGIGTTSGTLLGGFLVDRFGWRGVIWASLAVIFAAMVVLSFADNMVVLCACLLGWGVFGWTFTPSQTNRLLDTFPDNGPLLITLNGSAVQLGITAGGLTGAGVHAVFGVGALAPAAATILGAAMVIYWMGDRHDQRLDHR